VTVALAADMASDHGVDYLRTTRLRFDSV